uniref:Succinate:cytochrome c oxidoreductase subunit 4 n=1 Tax=Pyropia perforata TaxID=182771 RepID=A0A059STU1_PYRPE|nr:succinate:cytochrome c oxidoreductase subunit 4 [Neoporphyra perforata]AHB35393.1 succinate:cytochrome c oxidoreductase subunit 4 [Neoporphyra perforata]AHB35422.1 succinate:cytochrome c oxidoreductase subunit 4 [Neoporphyra perforata]AIB08081.1 succinate:cytochrome c oxidoreductase subunit 4 [Neoporphyra perforata]AIB08171.1 succinate:cytochrome c oxidoreductase subunit 4 [Neoporphyra perforata]
MQFIKKFILAFTFKKAYFFWLPRIFGLLLFPGFLFDIEVLILLQSLVLLHAGLGLEVIIEDYLHITITKLQHLSLVKIFSILLINLNILYLL